MSGNHPQTTVLISSYIRIQMSSTRMPLTAGSVDDDMRPLTSSGTLVFSEHFRGVLILPSPICIKSWWCSPQSYNSTFHTMWPGTPLCMWSSHHPVTFPSPYNIVLSFLKMLLFLVPCVTLHLFLRHRKLKWKWGDHHIGKSTQTQWHCPWDSHSPNSTQQW